MQDGLFDSINTPDTTIEVLVGARKFMEGWNSWRVSSMGLMNVGRREGSQIIQLFGRGVRLRGLRHGLKRSSALDGEHPEHIGLLETLNIFAIRADYMAQFKDYLQREDLHTEGVVELYLAGTPEPGVPAPRPVGAAGARQRRLRGRGGDGAVSPRRRRSVSGIGRCKRSPSRVQAARSPTRAHKPGRTRRIPPASLQLVDWNRVHLELLAYREQRGYPNLAFAPQDIRAVFESTDPLCLELAAEDNLVEPKTLADVAALSEAVLALAKKYMDRFYRLRQERWASKRMRYSEVRDTDANFQDYVVRVPRTGQNDGDSARGNARLLEDILQLIEEGERIYQRETAELPNIHFDRHLYQPLLGATQRQSHIQAASPERQRTPLRGRFARLLPPRERRGTWGRSPQRGVREGRAPRKKESCSYSATKAAPKASASLNAAASTQTSSSG